MKTMAFNSKLLQHSPLLALGTLFSVEVGWESKKTDTARHRSQATLTRRQPVLTLAEPLDYWERTDS